MNPELLLSKDVTFIIAKIIAETDSIGEQYSYCRNYTRDMFDDPNGETEEEYKQVAQQVQAAILKTIEELS